MRVGQIGREHGASYSACLEHRQPHGLGERGHHEQRRALERDADLPPEITAEIATEAELSALAPLSRGRAAARVFSAKEAAYKAQYPLTRCLFGFDAMTAHLPDGGMRMCADTGLGRGAALPMQQHLVAGRVLSLCLMPRPAVHG